MGFGVLGLVLSRTCITVWSLGVWGLGSRGLGLGIKLRVSTSKDSRGRPGARLHRGAAPRMPGNKVYGLRLSGFWLRGLAGFEVWGLELGFQNGLQFWSFRLRVKVFGFWA